MCIGPKDQMRSAGAAEAIGISHMMTKPSEDSRIERKTAALLLPFLTINGSVSSGGIHWVSQIGIGVFS